LTHAVKPSAAAGRVPAPLIEEPAGSHVTETVVLAIVTPDPVHDQFAIELILPEHFTVQLYGRSPMNPAGLGATASANGAVGVSR